MRLAQQLLARCRQNPDLIEQFKTATELVDEVQEAESELLKFRREVLRRLREEGVRLSVIAQRVGLSRSRLYQIAGKTGDEED